MNSSERTDFDILMRKLCIGLGVLPSPERLSAFFEGLEKMSLIQFSRVVDACLDADSACNGKLPTIPAVWKIWHNIRDAARAKSLPPPPKPAEQSRQLMQVNSMFFRYLHHRRLVENFKGDIDITGRRAECLKLVAYLEACAREDLSPSHEEVKSMFDRAMARIGDYEPETA